MGCLSSQQIPYAELGESCIKKTSTCGVMLGVRRGKNGLYIHRDVFPAVVQHCIRCLISVLEELGRNA